MDRLDGLLHVAQPLFDQLDEVLGSVGAPAEHAVWDELRRVRLLPGDAARAVAALRPSALFEADRELRAGARACAGVGADLPPPDDWAGEAAEAYDEVRHRIAGRLSGGDESLDERLEATADLAEALRDWMERTRDELAEAVAVVLGSSEVLMLAAGVGTPPRPADARAAADIAAHLLRTIADSYDEAFDLIRGSSGLASAVLV